MKKEHSSDNVDNFETRDDVTYECDKNKTFSKVCANKL